ncbi:hypothetical protein JF50_11190 [Pseudoalteromonas luteoviolacea]|uniref:NAD-dependent epimerase/dehydratase domain-containing protein n=1 Tax=Pseudoalteromonas luteoviolacea TaxID=43657 RepID=A0A0C1QAQ8_9GAMM|nr:NAD(P)-dependent oxidoreductase [Pseudoalteromonas luteoviolacea]KID57721.1 hypothetical protein JF50_11190 [Pseudoalteromonas luteoviolacea]
MDKTVILGGSGYIGHNVTKALSQQGIEVVALSRKDVDLEDSAAAASKLAGHLLDAENLIICSAITRTSANDTHSCNKNIKQLQTIISALQTYLPKRVIYLSAADVYGHYGSRATESSVLTPQNEYGAFKVFAENMLRINFAAQCKLSVLRFSGVFGGDQDTSSLIYRLHSSVINNTTISLSNNGLSKRDFVPVTLLAEVITQLVRCNTDGTFNVSTGQELNIVDLVSSIERSCDKKAALNLISDKSDRDFDLSLDNSKLISHFPTLCIPNLHDALARFLCELPHEH